MLVHHFQVLNPLSVLTLAIGMVVCNDRVQDYYMVSQVYYMVSFYFFVFILMLDNCYYLLSLCI